jgi:transcriptional regulator with XRE-family HTH domain
MNAYQFGQRIDELRKINGFNRTQLANRAGITTESLSRYIRGEHVPSCQIAADLARALNTTLDYLLEVVEEDGKLPTDYHRAKRLLEKHASKLSKEQKNELIKIILEMD